MIRARANEWRGCTSTTRAYGESSFGFGESTCVRTSVPSAFFFSLAFRRIEVVEPTAAAAFEIFERKQQQQQQQQPSQRAYRYSTCVPNVLLYRNVCQFARSERTYSAR